MSRAVGTDRTTAILLAHVVGAVLGSSFFEYLIKLK